MEPNDGVFEILLFFIGMMFKTLCVPFVLPVLWIVIEKIIQFIRYPNLIKQNIFAALLCSAYISFGYMAFGFIRLTTNTDPFHISLWMLGAEILSLFISKNLNFLAFATKLNQYNTSSTELGRKFVSKYAAEVKTNLIAEELNRGIIFWLLSAIAFHYLLLRPNNEIPITPI